MNFGKFLRFLILICIFDYAKNQQVSDSTDDVSLVVAIFREASRNPSNVDKFISNPAFGGHFRGDELWRKGLGRLNKLGKQQAYNFGQFLRRRYAKLLNTNLDDILDFEIAKAFSSSISCNQATLQLILAGMFPAAEGDSTWNNANNTGLWQPYLFTVNDKLTATTNTTCPELKKQYDLIREDVATAAQQWSNDDHRALTTFTERTGLNASLKNLSEFAEFIQVLLSFNTTLPQWLLELDKPSSTSSTPSILADVVQSLNISTLAPNISTTPTLGEPWVTKFLRYRQAHAQICANETECRRLVAGFFLNHILEVFMSKREDKLPKRKFHLYSSNSENLASIASLFQLKHVDENSKVISLAPLSGILLEYRNTPQPSVRFLSFDVGTSDISGGAGVGTNFLEANYCSKQEWCRLDVMIKSVGLDTFDDWDKACKTGDAPNVACASISGGTSIALVRDALAEQENSAPSENGKKLKSTECAFEWDKSGTRPCRNWASHGYCNLYDSVRWLFCRRTCLCNPEFL